MAILHAARSVHPRQPVVHDPSGMVLDPLISCAAHAPCWSDASEQADLMMDAT